MWSDRFLLHGLYIIVGCYGSFAWLIVPKTIRTRYNVSINHLVPDYILTFYFFPTFALYLYYDYVSLIADYWFIFAKVQETAELLLSLGFLLFVVFNKYRQSRYEMRGEDRCASLWRVPA